jgi:hypothetical protein
MNIGTKVFNKLLELLNSGIHKMVIHCYQISFIMRIQEQFNICKSKNVIQHIESRIRKPHAYHNTCRKNLSNIQYKIYKNPEESRYRRYLCQISHHCDNILKKTS